MKNKKICFIGSGNMTRSIVSGLIKNGYPAELIETTNPGIEKLNAMRDDFGVNVSQNNGAAAERADVIVLSVKPQMMETVCNQLSHPDLSNKLIITIAAGIPASRYRDYFKRKIKLIRAMPNTPAQIGVGVTGVFADDSISADEKLECRQIMQTGGEVIWVEKESDLNHVIALAGSAPAYFFMFMESMLDAAQKMNVQAEQARLMVQQTALGAAEMMKQNPELSAARLRENVTSKGGTTAEAINTFEKGGLRTLVDSAINNCVKRAEEMEKLF